MAKRKPRSSGVRRQAPPDLGTPETRAKLQLPPWADWSKEQQRAAAQIELAVRLQAGGSLAQAQDWLRVRHHAAEEDEDAEVWQGRLLRQYTWWRWEVVRSRWPLSSIIGCIVDHAPEPPELAAALAQWAAAPKRAWA